MTRFRARNKDGVTVTVNKSELQKFDKRLLKLQRMYPDATTVALFLEALEIFKESQQEVPVDDGILRESGVVIRKQAESGDSIVIGYGAAYAVRIHEDTSLDAKRKERAELALSNPGYTPRGAQTGKSKYLQDPFERALTGFNKRVAKEIEARVEKGRVSTSIVKTKRGRKSGGARKGR